MLKNSVISFYINFTIIAWLSKYKVLPETLLSIHGPNVKGVQLMLKIRHLVIASLFCVLFSACQTDTPIVPSTPSNLIQPTPARRLGTTALNTVQTTAWSVVTNDPRFSQLNLTVDTAQAVGSTNADRHLILVPETNIGFIKAQVNGSQVATLERWMLFEDGTFSVQNMLNGHRADFESLNTYSNAKNDPIKRNAFLALWKPLYETEATTLQAQNLQATATTNPCGNCTANFDAFKNAEKAFYDSLGDTALDVISNIGSPAGVFDWLSLFLGGQSVNNEVQFGLAMKAAENALNECLKNLYGDTANPCTPSSFTIAPPADAIAPEDQYAFTQLKLTTPVNSRPFRYKIVAAGAKLMRNEGYINTNSSNTIPLAFWCYANGSRNESVKIEPIPPTGFVGNVPPPQTVSIKVVCSPIPSVSLGNELAQIGSGSTTRLSLSLVARTSTAADVAIRQKFETAGFTWKYVYTPSAGADTATITPGAFVDTPTAGRLLQAAFKSGLKNATDMTCTVTAKSKLNPKLTRQVTFTVYAIQVRLFPDNGDPIATAGFKGLSTGVSWDGSNSGFDIAISRVGQGADDDAFFDPAKNKWVYRAALTAPKTFQEQPQYSVFLTLISKANPDKKATAQVVVLPVSISSTYLGGSRTSTGSSTTEQLYATGTGDATSDPEKFIWEAPNGGTVSKNAAGNWFYNSPGQNPAPSRVINVFAVSKVDPKQRKAFPITVNAVTLSALPFGGGTNFTNSGGKVELYGYANNDGSSDPEKVTWAVTRGLVSKDASNGKWYYYPPEVNTAPEQANTLTIISKLDPAQRKPIAITVRAIAILGAGVFYQSNSTNVQVQSAVTAPLIGATTNDGTQKGVTWKVETGPGSVGFVSPSGDWKYTAPIVLPCHFPSFPPNTSSTTLKISSNADPSKYQIIPITNTSRTCI
jgi:hypothetical protein